MHLAVVRVNLLGGNVLRLSRCEPTAAPITGAIAGSSAILAAPFTAGQRSTSAARPLLPFGGNGTLLIGKFGVRCRCSVPRLWTERASFCLYRLWSSQAFSEPSCRRCRSYWEGSPAGSHRGHQQTGSPSCA